MFISKLKTNSMLHIAKINSNLFKAIFLIFICCFYVPFSANCQNQIKKKSKKIGKADEFFERALILGDSAKYDSAVALLKQASFIYRKKGNTEKYIDCKNKIVEQSMKLAFNEKLLVTAEENLKLAINSLGAKNYLTGSAFCMLGEIYERNRKADSALYYYSKAKEIWEFNPTDNNLRIAEAYFAIGRVFIDKGEFEKALVNLNVALKSKIDSLGSYDVSIASIYNSFGILYYRKGSIDSCEYYFKKVVEIREKCYGIHHPLVADGYINLGVVTKINGDKETALTYYKKALDIFENCFGIFHPKVAMCYSNIGVAYNELGKIHLSNENYEKALNIKLKIFGENHIELEALYMNFGLNLAKSGKIADALMYVKKALDMEIKTYGENNPKTMRGYSNLGTLYLDFGDLDKALECYKKGVQILLKMDPNTILLNKIYGNIGIVYDKKGNYELALTYYNLALEVYQKQGIEKHRDIASTYHNMAGVYRDLGDFDKALEYLNKNTVMLNELFGENYFELAEVYLTYGAVQSDMANSEQARSYYEKGLKIIIENFGDDIVNEVPFLNNIASCFVRKKDYNEAFKYLQRSIGILSKTFGEDHPKYSTTYSKIGDIYENLNNYDSATYYYGKSLDANYIGALPEKIDYHYILDEIEFFETFFALADLNYRKYKNGNISYLKKALDYYQKAFDLISYIVSSYDIESSKLTLLKNASEHCSKAIQVANLLYLKTNNEEYLNQSLIFSEQNKSTILYQSIINANANLENFSDSVWVKLKNLSGKINYFKTKIATNEENNADSVDIKQFEFELSRSIIEYHALNEQQNRNNLKSAFIPFMNAEIIESVQKNLKPNEAILEYFDSDTVIYCFAISHDLIKMKKINVGTDFNAELVHYISIIKKHRLDGFQQLSYNLYDKLINPVATLISDKSKLIIIPDGHLLYLPFSALISKQQNIKNDIDFSKLNYLINNYEVVYQYSINLWLENFHNSKIGDGFLGIAPFVSKDSCTEKIDSLNYTFLDKDLPETLLRSVANRANEYLTLPYSEKEVEGISKLFEEHNFRSKKLIGNNASEFKLKELAKSYKYLHIATHGIINNIHPELSGLAFRRNDKDTISYKPEKDWKIQQNTDGVLYAKEIFDLDLNADLVVLSACESGIGKLEKGEGIISLTRGFLYNKVPNIVFSLWKISDKETCDFMISFYRNFLNGHSYSSALRQAKLDFIKDNKTAFPSSWAGFSLIAN